MLLTTKIRTQNAPYQNLSTKHLIGHKTAQSQYFQFHSFNLVNAEQPLTKIFKA